MMAYGIDQINCYRIHVYSVVILLDHIALILSVQCVLAGEITSDHQCRVYGQVGGHGRPSVSFIWTGGRLHQVISFRVYGQVGGKGHQNCGYRKVGGHVKPSVSCIWEGRRSHQVNKQYRVYGRVRGHVRPSVRVCGKVGHVRPSVSCVREGRRSRQANKFSCVWEVGRSGRPISVVYMGRQVMSGHQCCVCRKLEGQVWPSVSSCVVRWEFTSVRCV